jgi:hypothetical protein
MRVHSTKGNERIECCSHPYVAKLRLPPNIYMLDFSDGVNILIIYLSLFIFLISRLIEVGMEKVKH